MLKFLSASLVTVIQIPDEMEVRFCRKGVANLFFHILLFSILYLEQESELMQYKVDGRLLITSRIGDRTCVPVATL